MFHLEKHVAKTFQLQFHTFHCLLLPVFFFFFRQLKNDVRATLKRLCFVKIDFFYMNEHAVLFRFNLVLKKKYFGIFKIVVTKMGCEIKLATTTSYFEPSVIRWTWMTAMND